MPARKRQQAIRAYARAVHALGRRYGLSPMGRDPALDGVRAWHRQLLKRVHPDKGGAPEDFRTAQSAKQHLEAELTEHGTAAGAPPPRPRAPSPPHHGAAPGATPAATPPAPSSHGRPRPAKRPSCHDGHASATKRPAAARPAGPPPGESSRALSRCIGSGVRTRNPSRSWLPISASEPCKLL